MVFLKRFIANGFKSFATNTDIKFNDSMVGIVGPNGSGKSNIVDAIKWVLGEKSNKTLRGKVSDDIIFHGSKDHEPSDYAIVTLIFDNSSRKINIDKNEVSVTRKLQRGTGNNEYFINDEPCRLKDIHEAFLNTGLSKGSLGIISQGTVQWFVEAKPEDRRHIFEEAAGIGLYAKKKEESLSQLERATNNLNRVSDIVNELSKDVQKIQKQAEKAKIYAEKSKQLMELDLIISVKDIKYYQNQIKLLTDQINQSKTNVDLYNPDIKQISDALEFSRSKVNEVDNNIEKLTNDLTNIVEQINKIELRKQSLESRIFDDMSSENAAKKADAYKNLIESLQFDINDRNQKLSKINDEVESYLEILDKLSAKRNSLNELINEKSLILNDCKTQIRVINETISNYSNVDFGVKTILNNRQALSGICGMVKDFINVDQQYEKAISTALGKNSQNIIVNDDQDAKQAINFLKNNRAGKATFLPITSIRPRSIKQEHLAILNEFDGFVNVASKLIDFPAKYGNIYEFLLGNIIIASDLDNATLLSKYTYQMYRVISLDGDIVNAGGSITGGYTKANLSMFNVEQKNQQLNNQSDNLTSEIINLKNDLNKINSEINEINAKVNEKRILISRHKEMISSNENQLYKYQIEFDKIKSYSSNNINNDVNEINNQLSKLNAKKDKINEEINVNRQSKILNKSQVDDYEAKLNELRSQLDNSKSNLFKLETDLIKCQNIVDSAKNKINISYKMTLEFAIENYDKELPMSEIQAREIIEQLNYEINRLGSINMDAINELEEKQTRLDELKTQQQELLTAKENIEKAIAELDNKARSSFKETIDNVNNALPSIFKYLFGGGSCQVTYTDETDILTSGIDVMANPPGKNITNLNLLSGGEKTLVALSILFAILQNRAFPLVILDEAESALDPANVERFANIIKKIDTNTQFLLITHRPGTMERCDSLYGATMQVKGITSIFNITLSQANNLTESK